MDVTIYIYLIIAIVLLFVLLKYSLNLFLYVGIIVLSALGLIMILEDGVSIQTGTQVEVTNSNYINYTVESSPIETDLGVWKYVLDLFFLSSMIGGVMFWTYDNPKDMEN